MKLINSCFDVVRYFGCTLVRSVLCVTAERCVGARSAECRSLHNTCVNLCLQLPIDAKRWRPIWAKCWPRRHPGGGTPPAAAGWGGCSQLTTDGHRPHSTRSSGAYWYRCVLLLTDRCVTSHTASIHELTHSEMIVSRLYKAFKRNCIYTVCYFSKHKYNPELPIHCLQNKILNRLYSNPIQDRFLRKVQPVRE